MRRKPMTHDERVRDVLARETKARAPERWYDNEWFIRFVFVAAGAAEGYILFVIFGNS